MQGKRRRGTVEALGQVRVLGGKSSQRRAISDMGDFARQLAATLGFNAIV
jgi:hypothetical protein